MVRLPRLFGKKRGERRTGSPEWGRVTEAVLSGCLLAAGLVHGTVVVAGVVRPSWRIGFGVPVNEGEASPASLWVWLLGLLLPLVLLLLGVTGLIRSFRGWGRSEERRAAMGRLPDLLAPVAGAIEAAGLPTIPAFDHLTNSPGTTLAYRLPTENAEGWSLVAAGLFAGSWNAMLAVFVVGGGLGLRSAAGDPLMAVMLVAFGSVGVGSILLFIRRFLAAHAIGPTHLEVSSMPLEPGERCHLRLTQSGSCTLREIAVRLELEEQSTYRQGTDVRIERRVIARIPLAGWQDLRIGPATRFDGDAEASVPAAAMHSFVSEHNCVSWRFVVEGVPGAAAGGRRWSLSRARTFERAFPIVVVPAGSRDTLEGSHSRTTRSIPAAGPPAIPAGAPLSPHVAKHREFEADATPFDRRREVRVRLAFDRSSKTYAPGDALQIHYVVEGLGEDSIEGVERSVLWYTEGKGDEDLGVVHFERVGFTAEPGGGAVRPSTRERGLPPDEPVDPQAFDFPPRLATGSLQVRLPVSPLSYEGLIVKVAWCVRVRVFFSRRARTAHSRPKDRPSRPQPRDPQPPRDFVSEHVFQLGRLPPAGLLVEARTA
jgi:hypothetical protein